jgi:hypothetical protein
MEKEIEWSGCASVSFGGEPDAGPRGAVAD